MQKYIIILVVVIFSSCRDYCPDSYALELPFSLSPPNASFNVGDTILISNDFSLGVLDMNSGRQVVFDNFDVNSYFTIKDIGQNPFTSADTNFVYLTGLGDLSEGFSRSIYYDDSNRIEFKLIPKQSGLYVVNFYSYIDFEDGYNYWGNDCERFKIEDIHYKLNDGEDNNYDLLELSPDSLVRGMTKEVYDIHGSYIFEVL